MTHLTCGGLKTKLSSTAAHVWVQQLAKTRFTCEKGAYMKDMKVLKAQQQKNLYSKLVTVDKIITEITL